MVTIVDINNTPTAIVHRLDKNAPPIILYTIKPPAYSEHGQHELIERGPDVNHCQRVLAENEEDSTLLCGKYTGCICLLLLFLVILIIFGIIVLSCMCF
jgi:hypothetical protein